MSISSINEQLLRAVGVGIALFDAQSLELRFQNDVFQTWFEGIEIGAKLPEMFPEMDLAAMTAALDASGRFASEIRFKKKRRTLSIAQILTRTEVGEETLLVLECQNISRIRELETMIESYSTMVERNTRDLQREKEQVEKLLLSIMPRGVYEEYKTFGVVAPQRYASVSVLTLDFIDFNQIIEQLPPAHFVSELNEICGAFDKIGEQFSCERIKTTGDTYLCIAGMHDPTIDHATAAAEAALRFIHFLNRRNEQAETLWRCRIGVATGPVVGSVVGAQRYVYDVFGPAVIHATRMRDLAEAMEALVTAEAAGAIAESDGPGLVDPRAPAAGDAGARALSMG